MKNISVKGIIIALITMFLLDIISGIVMIILFAKGYSPAEIEALQGETNTLIFSLVFGNISTVIAGYIAAKFGKLAPYKNSMVIGVVGVFIGIFFISTYPLWFSILGILTAIPAAMLGGYFIARKNEAN